ncbi:hypothetical protein PAMP_002132 [Pampus punctatissimus]
MSPRGAERFKHTLPVDVKGKQRLKNVKSSELPAGGGSVFLQEGKGRHALSEDSPGNIIHPA